MYVSALLQCNERADLRSKTHNVNRSLESVCVEITIRHGTTTVVGAFYRPPSGSAGQFSEELISLMDMIYEQNDDVLLMGAINFDFSRPITEEISDCLHLLQLRNLVTQKTRRTATTATLLDVILTTHPAQYSESSSIDSSGISDHHLVCIARLPPVPSTKPKLKSFRDTSKLDPSQFVN